MTERPELLRLKKRIVLSYNLKLTAKHRKFHLETTDGIGPFVILKVLSNDNNFARRIDTNQTRILHRMIQKKLCLTRLCRTIIQMRIYSLTMR